MLKSTGDLSLFFATRAGHQTLMFVGSDVDGLINQQYWNPVVDAVGLVQPGVVEHIVDEQQWSPIGRAHQNA